MYVEQFLNLIYVRSIIHKFKDLQGHFQEINFDECVYCVQETIPVGNVGHGVHIKTLQGLQMNEFSYESASHIYQWNHLCCHSQLLA